MKRVRSVIAFLSLFLVPASLSAFNTELRNVSDDKLFSGLEFQKIGKSLSLHVAKQYLKIDYPEVVNQDIRIYTNNRQWKGVSGPDAAGLVHASTRKDSIPLYWISFSSPQPGGVSFSILNQSLWTALIDLNEPGFAQKKMTASIPRNSGSVSYLYFGARLPASAVIGDYATNLVIELISPVADLKPPVPARLTCEQVPLVNPLTFDTLIEDDFNVTSSTFYYRRKGDLSYSARSLRLAQNLDNPFQWKANTAFQKSDFSFGSYEYYIEASDGYVRNFNGTRTAPNSFQIVDEFTEFSGPVSANGVIMAANSVCAKRAGTPDLFFPQGSVAGNVIVSVKRLHPETLSPMTGQNALAAFDLGPSGMNFNRPVTLTIPYPDADQDGIVDGTALFEKDLRVFWFDGFDWRNMGGKVDQVANTITANISHFSVYALFSGGPLTAETVRPKEKIITPNGDGINDFAQFGISGDFEISIFNVQGSRIRLIQNINVWDGKLDDGRTAESGVYVYQVRSSQLDKPVSGTIGVAR